MPTPNSLFHTVAVNLIESSTDYLIYGDCCPSTDPDDNRTDFTIKVLSRSSSGFYAVRNYIVFRMSNSHSYSLGVLSNVKIYSSAFVLLREISARDVSAEVLYTQIKNYIERSL